MNAIMLSRTTPVTRLHGGEGGREAGVTFVTWDSPIPSAEGEQLFVAQVDFDETGQ